MAERELSRAPGMGGLFARAGLGMIPGVSALPVVGGRRAADVGDEVLVLADVEVDRQRLAAYDRVCGFSLRETLPPTYPHMLAFPLHLALMTDPSFPFPAIGLVHIYNRITQHRTLGAGERFSLRVWAEPIQPHPRGRQVSLRTEARVGEELGGGIDEPQAGRGRRGRFGARGSILGGSARRLDLEAAGRSWPPLRGCVG